jgi:GntR family transcriptional regulator
VRKYRVARATVRRALAQLQSEGLVYTKQGVGSFVAEPRVDQDLDQLFSFTEFMVYRHIRPGSKLLAAEVQRIKAPDSPILYYLGLKSGDRVIYVRRLRLGSGEPLVIANTWLPEARFPDFLKQDLEHESVYEIMRKLNHKPTDAVQTFEAVTLDREVAGLLTVPPGSAALLIRRVGYASGIPVEYAIDYYRGDRTKFRVRLGLLEQRITDRIRDDHIAI